MSIPGRRPCLLYIDDDQGLSLRVRESLERRGFDVVHSPSGAEGVARLAEGGIDVVALDHFMPGEDGFSTLQALRKFPDAPPVIYVTGSDDVQIAVAALKAGAVDYVWKDVAGHFRDLLCEAALGALAQEQLQKQKNEAEADMRLARERAEVLLYEVNHRIANSLQMVASLVAMQRQAVEDGRVSAESALLETQNRITAVAQVHRRLYTSTDVRRVDLKAYLEGLVAELAEAMSTASRNHAVLVEADPLAAGPDKAVAIGVIVSELMTNAFKYAFPDAASGGRVMVRLKREENGAVLMVEDNGVGMSSTTRGQGLGSSIVEAMATMLGAALKVEDARPGTRVIAKFELSSDLA